MIIVQFYQQICRIHTVYPSRAIFHCHILALAGHCIAQNHSADGLPSEQPYRIFFHGTYPIRHTILVDLKTQLIKNVSGILESQVSINIPV